MLPHPSPGMDPLLQAQAVPPSLPGVPVWPSDPARATHQHPSTGVFDRYRHDPEVFFHEVLGWTPWAKQTDIARALAAALRGQGPRRVAVRSGNGVGKTALAARLMLWALCCYESSVVVTTAPTQRQVTELLWREARSAYYRARARLGGAFYQGQPRWDLGPRRYAIGVSPEHTRPEGFQGFHADLILFLVDEASGIPPAHWEAIKGSLLAGNAAVLAIGNPTRLEGEFYDAFHGRASLWRRMHISAFDTPNLTGGNVPGLVTPAAVAEAARDWGEESPLYQIRVLGEFPSAASHQLIRFAWIEQAAEAPSAGDGFALGVDVARSGEDETAAVLLEGNRLARLQRWLGQNTMRTVAEIKGLVDELGEVAVAVDDGGVGGGVVDRLRELDVRVYAVKFGARPDGRSSVHFKNKLAEMYWRLRERLEAGTLRLPRDAALTANGKLAAQLAQIEWEVESDRVIRVHKRGLAGHAPSPDITDALSLALEAQAQAERGAGVWF